MNTNSEVRKLMQQITEEQYAAEQALYGLAEVASHEFITSRMERIGFCQSRLTELVGAQAATRLTVQAMNEAPMAEFWK